MLFELLEGEPPAGEKVVDYLGQGVVGSRLIGKALVNPFVKAGKDLLVWFPECLRDKEDRPLPLQLKPLGCLQANPLFDGFQQQRQSGRIVVLLSNQRCQLVQHKGGPTTGVQEQPQDRPSCLPVHGPEELDSL